MKTLDIIKMTTKKILLIDDELNVRELIESCFKDLAGWDVVTADSPANGLEKATVDHPDAIVLDLSMSSMNACQFINQLRNNPKTQAIPIVLLSAKARWLDSQILQKYQIAGIILKPFDPVVLSARIAKLLGWDFHVNL